MSLFAKELGEGGVPIVFLHGFGASHAVWGAIQAPLARQARTLAYDLPGHAGSHGVPDAGPAKNAARAVLADLARRGHDRAHVVGHSMGGAVAALMAIFEPARIASLTLLSPGGFGEAINHRLLTRFSEARDETEIRTCLEAMTGWYSPVTDDMVDAALAARAGEGRAASLVEIARGLAVDGRQGQLPLDRLTETGVPAAVVWGGLDNVLPPRQALGVPPSFAVHFFPDLGHMLPEEAPADMLEIVRRMAGVVAP